MFRALKEEQAIGKEVATKLENMAGFRNLLIHTYGEIDNRKVPEITKHNLKDIKEFEKKTQKFINP